MIYRTFVSALELAEKGFNESVNGYWQSIKEHKKVYFREKLISGLNKIIELRANTPAYAQKYDAAYGIKSQDEALAAYKLNSKALRIVSDVRHKMYLTGFNSKLMADFNIGLEEEEEPVGKPEVKITATVHAPAVLEAGAKHMRDRAVTYDKPEGERSMEKVVQMFNLFTGHNLKESEGWRFMLFLKLVRSVQGEFKLDNFEDAVAYEALAAEAAAKGK